MKKMHELGRLIASTQERNGWSDRDLQLRAEKLELTALSKSNFSRWRNQPVNSIKGSNIRDLAAVLGVSESTVAHAALESMGISASTQADSSVDTALSLDPELSARDKTLVRALLGAMSTAEERDGSGSAAPMNRPAGDPGGNQHHEHDEKTPTAASAVGDELPADLYGLAALEETTPGMAARVSIDAAGEESQVPPDEGA